MVKDAESLVKAPQVQATGYTGDFNLNGEWQMAKDFMCEYSNCSKLTTNVIVSVPGERVRFCCEAHASMWLLTRAAKNEPTLFADAVVTMHLAIGNGE